MPVKVCRWNDKPGYRWGSRGKCFTYNAGDEKGRQRALAMAEEQGNASNTGSTSKTTSS